MTQDAPSKRRPRRMAREPQTGTAAAVIAKPPSRLDQLQDLLSREGGATIADMVAATGWQQHSVRGAMAGALKKKRGLVITSDKADGVRRYRASLPS
ncbi:DUF3489 domain-containing protein [Croceicoccus ponticola]|uniref:DUF3489 domain-containing protein n=1 Tax=Croceicoccus ponticola TaxID=2217664 RepID=A0A437GUC3_9SPHN|nr:DUF3489 domain-containing protein [Croceicoccus ponticola]RVQ64894.1 DUF3489 domain-containing protein [Croceicoccus ponticola]